MKSEDFNEIQQTILRSKAKADERVGWFAGASISLSFTLLGYLLSKHYFTVILFRSFCLSSTLIFGWMFLGLSIVGSLLISWLGETWLYDASSYQYLMGNDPFAQAMKKADPKLPEILNKRARLRARAISIIEILIYVGGIVGIILLLSFLIQLVVAISS